MHAHAGTILLVEAAQDDRAMYAEYLHARNFRALEVGDTADALRMAPAADVIVTGIHVPGRFDGLELVRRLRADSRTRRKPIVVLTAYALQVHRDRAFAAGADLFLPKPCLPEDLLLHIVGALLPVHPAGSSVRAPQRRPA